MKKNWKRICVIVLAAVLLISMCPTAWADDIEIQMVGLPGKSRMIVGDSAGTYSVTFETMPTVSWRVSSSSSWLTINTPNITGNSSVSFSVQSNPAATTRIAIISFSNSSPGIVGNRNVVVVQGNMVYPVGGNNNSAAEVHHIADATKGKVVNGIGSITSFYGYRTTAGTYPRHWAVDIDVGESTDTEAYAALNGKVITVGYGHETNGNYVVLEHTVIDSSGKQTKLKTKYLHLKTILVTKGTNVRAGTKIGIVGDTGSAIDRHLHFAILKQVTVTENGKNVNKYFHLNPVAYYHGCDDRGFLYKTNMTVASMTPKDNNPMFIVEAGKWVVNPEWDPTYASFTDNLCNFYHNYLNAKRNGGVIVATE